MLGFLAWILLLSEQTHLVETSTMKTKILILTALTVGFLGPFSLAAHAKRYNAGGHVMHTRLAPVVVHRIFPPYGLGVHVYSGRGGTANTVRR